MTVQSWALETTCIRSKALCAMLLKENNQPQWCGNDEVQLQHHTEVNDMCSYSIYSIADFQQLQFLCFIEWHIILIMPKRLSYGLQECYNS